MYNNNFISIVIPAYNEENLIGTVISTVPSYIDKIIVIDDGSEDSTSKIVKSFEDHRIILIRHEVNGGVGAAIVTGYRRSIEEHADI